MYTQVGHGHVAHSVAFMNKIEPDLLHVLFAVVDHVNIRCTGKLETLLLKAELLMRKGRPCTISSLEMQREH